MKYIYDSVGGASQLFDLTTDEREEDDLSASQPGTVMDLFGALVDAETSFMDRIDNNPYGCEYSVGVTPWNEPGFHLFCDVTDPTESPSPSPSAAPSKKPTSGTPQPTRSPSAAPTAAPSTRSPSTSPTASPSEAPRVSTPTCNCSRFGSRRDCRQFRYGQLAKRVCDWVNNVCIQRPDRSCPPLEVSEVLESAFLVLLPEAPIKSSNVFGGVCKNAPKANFMFAGRKRTCKWLAKDKRKARRKKLCRKRSAAGMACIKTCRNCGILKNCKEKGAALHWVSATLKYRTCMWLRSRQGRKWKKKLCKPGREAYYVCRRTCSAC